VSIQVSKYLIFLQKGKAEHNFLSDIDRGNF